MEELQLVKTEQLYAKCVALNHTKSLPTKMKLIRKDEKVRKLFLKTVQDLLK